MFIFRHELGLLYFAPELNEVLGEVLVDVVIQMYCLLNIKGGWFIINNFYYA